MVGRIKAGREDVKEKDRDLCKTPICGAFLRCALLARLPNSMLCLRSLRCYALNCIRIRGFCKGLRPSECVSDGLLRLFVR